MFHNPYYGLQAYVSHSASEEEIKQYIDTYIPPASLRPGLFNRGRFIAALPLIRPAAKVIPEYIFEAKTPEDLRQENQTQSPQQQKINFYDKSYYNTWDESAIRFRKPSWAYEWLSFLMIILLIALLFVQPLMLGILIFSHDYSLAGLLHKEQFNLLPYLNSGALGIIAICWILKKTHPRQGLGCIYEFNRRSGFVSKLKYPLFLGFKKPKVTKFPFTEMEGVICSRVTGSEVSSRYDELIFQHRFSSFSFTLRDDCKVLIFSQQTAADYWHFIQNYMDISKTLPDIPLFEKYRSKDPTSAEYDQNKHRKPDYWLNMDDGLWSQKINANFTKLRAR
ncbi:MAG: hypothetical protein ACRCWR_09040 [Saezia sp.]